MTGRRGRSEIWTVFNPNDTHGVTNNLQKDELNDLIEYLRKRYEKDPGTIVGVSSRGCCGGHAEFPVGELTTANRIPDNHVFSVAVDGKQDEYDEIAWAYKTESGGCPDPEDGLAHRAVLYVAPDPRTGDVWIATMGGLSRFSAGRFDTFTQLTSGLANDVVYGAAVQGDFVWVATAAGGSRLNTRTNQWSLFNERNTPMYEIWTYAVNATASKVYYAVWGGGVLEYDVKTERWKDYNDPDEVRDRAVQGPGPD